METRVCHFCNAIISKKDYCIDCVDNWYLRLATETMTPDEREQEFRSFDGPMEVPFELYHKRIEQLVGRPIWTHEIGLNWEGLCKECRWENRPATMNEILTLIPEDRLIIANPNEI